VLGRRPDGFHEVETLLLALPWGDDVEVRTRGVAPGVALTVEGGADVPRGADNLAARAARAWQAEAARLGRDAPAGVAVRLVKRVPPGAGLGGGSSDAAAVLAALEEETPVLGATRLDAVAATLGSDVPFFLLPGGVAVGRGRGERLEPLPRPPAFDLVLILPRRAHDTGRVYAAHDPRAPAHGGLDAALAALASGEPEAIRAAHHNGLAAAAGAAYPEHAALVAAVTRRLGRAPLLSGSGSALLDVPDPGESGAVLARLADLPATTLLLHV